MKQYNLNGVILHAFIVLNTELNGDKSWLIDLNVNCVVNREYCGNRNESWLIDIDRRG